MKGVVIRQAVIEELDALMQWRMEVLHEVFSLPAEADTAALERANREYYQWALPCGEHIACFAVTDGGGRVGCGGLCLQREMPSPDNPSGRCAYLMNVYVKPPFRHGSIVSNHICYILLPMPINDKWVSEWAERHATCIATVGGIDWDNDLTPWCAQGVQKGDKDFQGRAADFLAVLRSEIMPKAESALHVLPTVSRTLIGISLSGLFAVWALTRCDDFTRVASLSGSFWYDGFPQWMASRPPVSQVKDAYFSLGDREGTANDHPRFRTVAADTERVIGTLRKAGVQTTFERVPGTHFAPLRPRLERMFQVLFQREFDDKK